MNRRTPADQIAAPLLRKMAKALAKPGVSRRAVFGPDPSPEFFVYSLDTSNPEQLIRENCEGRREVGRMVRGKFRKMADLS